MLCGWKRGFRECEIIVRVPDLTVLAGQKPQKLPLSANHGHRHFQRFYAVFQKKIIATPPMATQNWGLFLGF